MVGMKGETSEPFSIATSICDGFGGVGWGDGCLGSGWVNGTSSVLTGTSGRCCCTGAAGGAD